MPRREQPYRGTFRTPTGALVGLDFFADNRALALSHAACVATDPHAVREFGGPLVVCRVVRLSPDDGAMGASGTAVRCPGAGLFYRL
jgi:hypothetical protein